jgi:hypothetical protein
LRRAVHLGGIDVESGGNAARGHGLAQAIEAGIQALAGIELRVRNETAGVVQRGVQKDLHASAAGALDPRAEEHVGLPDLIGKFGFELFARLGCEQFAFR